MNFKGYPLAVSLAILSVQAFAVPDSSDVLRESQMVQPMEKKSPLPNLEYKTTESKRLVSEGTTVFIKGFRFVGNTVYSSEELDALIETFRNKELSFAQIDEAVIRITEQYRKDGFFVARAYLPAQEISDGILTIGVIEGHFGDLRLSNRSEVSSDVIQSYLDAIEKEKPIHIDASERAVLLINNLSGVRVSAARLSPGKEVGTSDLSIETVSEPILNGYVWGDNFGSRYTGYNRLGVQSTLNSLWNQGEKIILGGMLSDNRKLESGYIAYEMPLGKDGLIAHIGEFKTLYELGEEYKNLNAHGSASGFELSLRYPFKKTRLESLVLDAEWKRQYLTDRIDLYNEETKKTGQSLKISLEWEKENSWLGSDGKTTASIAWTTGNITFNDAADAQYDASSARKQGNFNKIDFSGSRMFYLEKSVNLNVYGRGQYVLGEKNLDGSEEMSLGGATGVRFYSPSEHNGDQGYFGGIELSYRLPQMGGVNTMLSLFSEAGRAWQDVALNGDKSSRILRDAGIGCTVNYENFFIKSYVAKALGDAVIVSDKHYDTKWLIQGGMTF